MITIILVELAVAALAGLAFVAVYRSSPWRTSDAGRHMMAVSAVMAAESLTLLAAGLHLPVPLWLFAVGYAVMDVVVIQRLLLLWRARREERKRVGR